MIHSSGIRLLDRSGVAEARRTAVQHAARVGFGDADRNNVAIVATELASNLLRHARDGALSITSRRLSAERGVLLVAVDKGPGMPDLDKSFADGYSSAGSSGTGLGAVARLSTLLDVYSTPAGTVLAAELIRDADTAARRPRIGGFGLAKEGQETNGDAWACRLVDDGLAVLVCDGLGHGTYATEASIAACATFRAGEWRGAENMLANLDAALRPTRGAAAAIAVVNPQVGRLRYAGVGNIAGCIVSGSASRHLVSHNGILGHTRGRMTEFDYVFEPGSTLVMHSDGISARWQPDELGPIWERHPGLVAGLLYRDFSRGNDDVAAVVIRP
jgi:anti-sigma regulatory factor (Ser/Thr protein kinase)